MTTVVPSRLSDELRQFFWRLKDATEHELCFYGSVLRSDYVPGKSDIDLAIFTDNEDSLLSKLSHVLGVRRDDFSTVVWKLNGEMLHGHKLALPDVPCEICVYNNDYRDTLLREFMIPLRNSSVIVFALLFVLKLLYYQIPLLSKTVYARWKRWIMNDLLTHKESVFYPIRKTRKN
jgi:hypothetical protein